MSFQAEFDDLKVLLVEDQHDVREMVVRMLKDTGIKNIQECANGKEAITKLEANYNVVICDWNMPEMSGVEMLRQLRLADKGLPFLMMTGRADAESVIEARKSGVTGYISKPFTAQQLEAKLRIVMHRKAKAS